ncbi:MAG: carboxypeptidase regulatory-like domain-containing protein [Candidatus Kuenenia sp.]|nr:carboxypeptidase regulatory-like domain-containing protein [Candidatus Kuenenia hertensis]
MMELQKFGNTSNNDPVESVKIKIKGKNSGKKEKTITDEEGLFEFDNLIADTYKITGKEKGLWKTKQTVQLDEIEEKINHKSVR